MQPSHLPAHQWTAQQKRNAQQAQHHKVTPLPILHNYSKETSIGTSIGDLPPVEGGEDHTLSLSASGIASTIKLPFRCTASNCLACVKGFKTQDSMFHALPCRSRVFSAGSVAAAEHKLHLAQWNNHCPPPSPIFNTSSLVSGARSHMNCLAEP
jgi:hypothetical protein